MTVDSLNIEAVSSRTKPKNFLPQSFAESVLSCPKCGNAMEPMLLGFNDDGSQTVWWTCSEVKNKKCTYPLDMPQDIFWVTRSAQDIEKDEVPPPNLSNLPIRYQHLYPSLFHYTRKTPHDSRQGSHESTRSISSGPSDGSANSVWDVDETAKSRTAVRLDAMRKPKVITTTQKKAFIPSLHGASRAMAFMGSLNHEEASTSIQTRLRLGRGEKKISAENRDAAKKKVIRMLSTMNPASFKHLAPMQVQHMKKAVIEHVKRRRAEREQLAELERINEKRNKVIDLNDLIKSKLEKNKRKYEEHRLELAREARQEAAKRSRLAAVSQPSLSSMPGYGDEEEEAVEGQPQHAHDAAPYAVTPPYMAGGGSPGSSTSSFYHEDNQLPQEYDYVGDDFADINPMGMDHSGEVPLYGGEGEVAGSPFAELGTLTDDDLEGIVNDPSFEDTFATAFGEDFADLSHYN